MSKHPVDRGQPFCIGYSPYKVLGPTPHGNYERDWLSTINSGMSVMLWGGLEHSQVFFPILRALGYDDLIVSSNKFLEIDWTILDLFWIRGCNKMWTFTNQRFIELPKFPVFWCEQVPDALLDWNIYHPENIQSHLLIVDHSYWTCIHGSHMVDGSEILEKP